MKKILAIILVATIAFAVLPSISAPQQEFTPGAPVIKDYCEFDPFILGTFTLKPGQSISYNIPVNSCSPVKKEQIGWSGTIQGLPIGVLSNIGVSEADTSVVDRRALYTYNCYYTGSCSWTDSRMLLINGAGPYLKVNFYGAQNQFLYYATLGQGYEPCPTCSVGWGLLDTVDHIEIINESTVDLSGEVRIQECCCYDCYKEKNLPATLLYPKVDIETFSVPGGDTVIQDGKVISAFEMSPGSQQVFLQVENRGFFTQNEASIRFDGLPNGIIVEVMPETQKIKAHNIGTYSATFTVGSNVPSGKYQVTMVAYSPNGMFDKAVFEFVVQ